MNDDSQNHSGGTSGLGKGCGWVTVLLLVIPVFSMAYVSIAFLYPPIQVSRAVIFSALKAAPLLIQIEWYSAALIGLFAIIFVRKNTAPGLVASVLLAAAYVHLHLALLGNIAIPAWLAVSAAVVALAGFAVGKRRPVTQQPGG